MTSADVEEWEAPDPKRISQLPTKANSFAEVVAALRDGSVRHVLGPVPRSQQPFAAAGLRMAGLSFVEISDALGLVTVPLRMQSPEDVDAGAALAKRLVAEGLATLTREDETSRDEHRALASARIDALIAPLWAIATDPEHVQFFVASDLLGKHLDRHIKLNGLNAPTEHVIHTPGAERIAEIIRKTNPQHEVEADPFAYEEIEDAIVVTSEDVL